MFLCQFHQEKKPSFSVRGLENYGHCFGCKKTVDTLAYLKDYEQIRYSYAVKLLANIYLIDIKGYSNNFLLIKKYQSAITSLQYQDFMEECYYRSLEKYGNNGNIIKKYQKIKKIISRIQREEYDTSFILTYPNKQYILIKKDVDDLYDNA